MATTYPILQAIVIFYRKTIEFQKLTSCLSIYVITTIPSGPFKKKKKKESERRTRNLKKSEAKKEIKSEKKIKRTTLIEKKTRKTKARKQTN